MGESKRYSGEKEGDDQDSRMYDGDWNDAVRKFAGTQSGQ